jgi:7-cyano-7-deazaguanine synthase
MKVVVVLSGGMDSTAALAWAKKFHEVVGTLTFNYGSKHNAQENVAAANVATRMGVPWRICTLPLDGLLRSDLLKSGGDIPEGHYADPSMKRTVVPFRNGILLSVAAGYAESIGAEGLVLGNHAGDHAIYPDCREEFTRPMSEAIEAGTYGRIRVLRPFEKLTKADIAKGGTELGAPFELTYSCYNGREKHCARCGTCYERKEAFCVAGIPDPTVYE